MGLSDARRLRQSVARRFSLYLVGVMPTRMYRKRSIPTVWTRRPASASVDSAHAQIRRDFVGRALTRFHGAFEITLRVD